MLNLKSVSSFRGPLQKDEFGRTAAARFTTPVSMGSLMALLNREATFSPST